MQEMKISIADWAFWRPKFDLQTHYHALRDAGVSAVEMVPAQRREAVRDAGLACFSTIGPGMAEGLNRPSMHQQCVEDFKLAIDEACRDNIDTLVVFSGETSDEKGAGWSACLHGFEQVLPLAQDAGVTLLFEPLNPFDHPGYEAVTSDYAIRLAQSLNSSRFRVLLDVYHLIKCDEDPVAAIERCNRFLGHVHLATPPERINVTQFDPGVLQRVLVALNKVSYDGHLGLEFTTTEPVVDAIRQAVSYLKSAGAAASAADVDDQRSTP